MGRKVILMVSVISGLLFLLSITGELQAQVDWCSIAQGDAQQTVTAGGPYKNHGQMVKTAAQAANPYLYDGRITEECHSCIVNQFARNVPIEWQEACVSTIECPCFGPGDIEGQGIDYMAQELLSVGEGAEMCGVYPDEAVFLVGCRYEPYCSEDGGWLAQVDKVYCPNCCIFLDGPNMIYNYYEGLSDEQAQACIDIILDSYMWQLNCLPD